MPKPVTRWRCDECGDMHLSEASASLCETSHVVRKVTDGFRDDLAEIMARRAFMRRARLRLGIPYTDDADHRPPDGATIFNKGNLSCATNSTDGPHPHRSIRHT